MTITWSPWTVSNVNACLFSDVSSSSSSTTLYTSARTTHIHAHMHACFVSIRSHDPVSVRSSKIAVDKGKPKLSSTARGRFVTKFNDVNYELFCCVNVISSRINNLFEGGIK